MTLNDLDLFFADVTAAISELGSYHFGYLYEINEDRSREYPLCLFIPPQPKLHAYEVFDDLPVVLYFYDLYNAAEYTVKSKSKKWTELQIIGQKFIDAIKFELPVIDGSVAVEYGIYEHDDRLVGVKVSLTIKMPSACDLGAVQLAIADMPEHVFNEVPSGAIDGVNTTFTLATTPKEGTLTVYLPTRQKLGDDYTVSGNTITFTVAPAIGSVLIVDYIKE